MKRRPVPLAISLVAPLFALLLFAIAPLAAAASGASVSAPAHVTIGKNVTVWVSGRTATDIASGAGVSLELQPTANRGGNGIAAAPKFSAYVVGQRVEVTFRWPSFVQSCFGASECVNTPWHIGSRADVDVCAQSPDGAFDNCGMTTVVVRR
jgi:hypothetical protein